MQNFSKIPAEMREYRQWICWKKINRQGKETKIPIDPVTSDTANVQDMSTWGSFEQAVQSAHQYDGIGFVLTEYDPYCFIDFDDPFAERNRIQRYNHPEAILQTQINAFNYINSYSEVSPSGKGLHIITKANIPFAKRGEAVEIYTTDRYMTMTGNIYGYSTIEHRQEQVSYLWESLKGSENSKHRLIDSPQVVSDYEIMQMASSAANGVKFQNLWNGDIYSYHQGDHSRADFALIDILAFYTQNVAQIKRMFRDSQLGQREKAKRETYIDVMIERAFDKILPTIDILSIANSIDEILATKELPKFEKEIEPEIERTAHSVKVQILEQAVWKEVPQSINEKIDSIQDPPGFCGDICRFIYRSAWKPVPQIALVGALGFCAGIVGRNFTICGKGLNLYLLLLARTGRGKEAISEGHAKIYDACKLTMPQITDFRGPGDLASGQGLLRYMSDHRLKTSCSIFSEFGKILERITEEKASQADRMTMKVLLDIYSKSGPSGIIEPTMYSDSERNTKEIQSPAFTFIGESNPQLIEDNLTLSMISSGLLPRFVIMEYAGERVPSNYECARVTPDEFLVNRVQAMASQSLQMIHSNTFYEVPFDPDDKDYFDGVNRVLKESRKLDKFCDNRINNSPLDVYGEIWNRVHLNTLKIAAVLAVADNPYDPKIKMEFWQWAEKFVLHSALNLEAKFENGKVMMPDDPGAITRALGRCIVEYLTNPQMCSPEDSVLQRFKVVPYRYLQKRSTSMPIFKKAKLGANSVLKSAVGMLVDNGDLIELPKSRLVQEFQFSGRAFAVSPDFLRKNN